MKELNFISPFKKLCITIGNLPTAYIESMSYYEGLTFLVNYLANNVIPAVNNNSEVVKELQDQFVILQNYVNNYFENLDVQEEINNKLDEMAAGGQLTDIIAQYLGLAGMLVYGTVADMKAAENIVEGSKLQTYGYHSIGDGGAAKYNVRKILNTDVIDEMFIIALDDPTLIAELILNGNYIPEQLGAKNDGSTDCSSIFNAIFDKMDDNNKIELNGTYLIDDKIYLSNKNNITISGGGLIAGSNLNGYILNSNLTAVTGKSGYSYKTENLTLENVYIDGNYTANGLYLDQYLRVKIISCTFHNFKDCGIYLNNGHECEIIGTNLIGRAYGEASLNNTGIIINAHDNIIDSCVMAYCQWAIEVLQNENQINNSHFYCNQSSGGNLKINKAAFIQMDNNYFDGSGIYAINPWHLIISNSNFVVSDNTQHIIEFNKDGGTNPNIRGIFISNTIVHDLRSDTSTPYDLLKVDFAPDIANTSACYIDKISYPNSITLNNPYNIFSFKNDNIPVIIPESFFRATNNSHVIGTHGTLDTFYEVKYNANYIDSNYIGPNNVYQWLFIKIYVPERMKVEKQMISNTSTDIEFFQEDETYISQNRATLDPGVYIVGIYRTHTILLKD